MRRGWRLIRQRGRRARSGQVSAVATIFALLLFVSFLATFVLGQLTAQMTQVEFQHELQVEDQMLRLQTAVLQAAATNSSSVVLSSPVTLGSGSVPPFGPPSSGYLEQQPSVSALSAGLGLANVTPSPPNWNVGSPCFGSGNGTCSGNNGPFVYWNFSGNHSTLTPGTTGCGSSGCTVIYNISGNFNTISLHMGGGAKDNASQNIIFVVFGNWDNMTLSLSGSCKNHHVANIFLVGTNDTYTLSVSGACNGGASINTLFIGSLGFICPYGNGVLTDRFLGATWGSSGGVYQNLTWQNAIGHVSAPHTLPENGGNDFLTFANKSGYTQCPFTKETNSGPYTLEYLSGLTAHLNNRYLPPTEVAYASGAIILGVQNGGSVMVSPPPFSIQYQPFGITLSLTLVNVLGASPIATGVGTAAALTQVLGDSTYHIRNGQFGNGFLTFLELNITTAYPLAWATFWNTQSAIVPSGTLCVPGHGVSASLCLTPPFGRDSTIVVPLAVSELYLTTLTVSVSIV